MPIHVSLFAVFAEFAGVREVEVPFRSGMTCDDVWNDICSRYPEVQRIPPLFAIDDEYVDRNVSIKDGDHILLFPPVSGGMSRFLYDSPLSVERSLDAICDENGGGEAIFIGRVRKISEGKIIRHLYYECSTSMAEKEIEKIRSEMFSAWPLKKVHFEHRVGKLEIGDIAVIVAVSAEHRKEAIEACRYGIDELKHRVPIWKKEVSETGEEWVGSCEH